MFKCLAVILNTYVIFFFIALHTSFPPFAIFMHKWQHMSMPQQHENYTCTSLSENLKMFWQTVS